MTIDFNAYIQKLKTAPENIRELLKSDTVGKFSEKVLTEQDLSLDLKPKLIILISYKVLGLAEERDFPDFLAKYGVADDAAQTLIVKIKHFLDNPPAIIPASDPDEEDNSMADDIAEAEAVLDKLTQSQAGEEGSETVHSSSQYSLVKNPDLSEETTLPPPPQPPR